ncbi:lantibiotic dehydratase C-terminal domain-containing protein [Nonomuraea typhae]|uniref:Lantibiotic dehydratase C-terminal domain-containing protein n=1 Tax=Nonomuraea typhae TaxID=2603600 RepID=A0ABW7YSR4_9ACTN
MTEPRWISIHAHYHHDLDPLLIGAVAPLIDMLRSADLLERWFFLRYWEGGPHLRIRLLPRRHGDASAVRGEAVHRLGSWLAANPAPGHLPEDLYEAHARTAAALEGRPGPPTPLRPAGTLDVRSYPREHAVYGRGPALDAAERHFCESSDLALAVVMGTGRPARRHGSALAALTLTMAACGLPPVRLGTWLARTWGAWWSSEDRPRDLQPIPLDEAPPAHVTEQVRELWRLGRAGRHEPGGAAAAWTSSIRSARTAFLGDPGMPESAALSPFVPLRQAAPGPAIAALLRCAHLYNNRIAVNGPTEGMVFALATRALLSMGDEP